MKNRKELPLNSPVFLVIRYHSAPVAFATLAEAEDFAMNCGDFADLVEPLLPRKSEKKSIFSLT